MGADAAGGNGTGIIPVTVVGPDGAPGTFRAAVQKIDAANRRIVVDPSLSMSTLVLDIPLFIKEPNITIDCNGATIFPKNPNTNGLGIGATHDVIVKNCRFKGHFKGSAPNWVPQQNSGNGYLDGDVPPLPCKPWDTVCQGMSPAMRRSAVNVIFDQCTWTGIQDDGLSIWGGGRRISFTRNFGLKSFHLSTTGWKGTLTDPALMRLWISWHYNVTTKIGERNLAYPREGTHWWFFDRNFVEGWTWYSYKDYLTGKQAWNAPQGVRISGQAPNESNMGWMRANCALGTAQGMPAGGPESAFDPAKANSQKTWGMAFDSGGCDQFADNSVPPKPCCAPSCTPWSGYLNFGCCHPRASKGHYYAAGNEGEVHEWAGPWPKNYAPPAAPYMPDLTRSWAQVLDEAGVPKQWRTVEETEELLRLAGRAAECKVAVPPPQP